MEVLKRKINAQASARSGSPTLESLLLMKGKGSRCGDKKERKKEKQTLSETLERAWKTEKRSTTWTAWDEARAVCQNLRIFLFCVRWLTQKHEPTNRETLAKREDGKKRKKTHLANVFSAVRNFGALPLPHFLQIILFYVAPRPLSP